MALPRFRRGRASASIVEACFSPPAFTFSRTTRISARGAPGYVQNSPNDQRPVSEAPIPVLAWLASERMVYVMKQICVARGQLKRLRVDRAPECTGALFYRACAANDVELGLSAPLSQPSSVSSSGPTAPDGMKFSFDARAFTDTGQRCELESFSTAVCCAIFHGAGRAIRAGWTTRCCCRLCC